MDARLEEHDPPMAQRTPKRNSWRAGVGIPMLVAALGVVAGCEDTDRTGPGKMPGLGELNTHVIEVVRSYPTDGTHGYHWPRPDPGTWLGFTRTMRYDGHVLGTGDPKGRCHCSGLTFEVFLRAWERWCTRTGRPYRIRDLSFEDVRRLRRQWFGATGDRATLHTAITKNDLGVRVVDLETARPGDFVQLWRHSGSGHSCVFLGWEREGKRIVGLRYWSTQSSTKGIGERTERFGDGGASVKREELYVCRIGRPLARSTSKPEKAR